MFELAGSEFQWRIDRYQCSKHLAQEIPKVPGFRLVLQQWKQPMNLVPLPNQSYVHIPDSFLTIAFATIRGRRTCFTLNRNVKIIERKNCQVKRREFNSRSSRLDNFFSLNDFPERISKDVELGKFLPASFEGISIWRGDITLLY